MKWCNELDHRVCKSIARGTTGPNHRWGGGGDLYKLNNEVSINSLGHCYLAAFKWSERSKWNLLQWYGNIKCNLKLWHSSTISVLLFSAYYKKYMYNICAIFSTHFTSKELIMYWCIHTERMDQILLVEDKLSLELFPWVIKNRLINSLICTWNRQGSF